MRLGLLLALIAALALAPAARAQVTVEAAGQDPATVDVAALQGSWDVRERPYTVGGAPAVVSGLSIDRLLAAADLDPFNFTGATVEAGGDRLVLTRDELIDPDAFAEGRPVLYPDGQGTAFLLPARGGAVIGGAEVRVRLSAASDLRVSATASRQEADAGQRIAFTATVAGAGAGEDVRISWNFDGSGSATGAEVSHRFRRPGTYKVVVGATSDANPSGASDVVSVRVGEPPEAGPDRDGGGTNAAAGAPDSGAATGASGTSSAGAASESQDAGAARRGEQRAAARPRAGETEASRRARAAAARRRTRETAARRRSARRARPAEPRGDEIEGTLIGAPFEPPPPAPGGRAAARAGVPREPAPRAAAGGRLRPDRRRAGGRRGGVERRPPRRSGTVGPWTAPVPPT